jgi:hypothetical protein
VGDTIAAVAAVDCPTRDYVAGVRASVFGTFGLAADAYLDHNRAR